jgi:sugar lactone lactonase YvrE
LKRQHQNQPAAGLHAIATEELVPVGQGLVRPECVLAHESGLLFAADWEGAGGVAIIDPEGSVQRIFAQGHDEILRPNGIALEAGGTFLLTHLGVESGGVFRLAPSGDTEPVVTHIDGRPLPPTNFVALDPDGGMWITVSTRVVPRADDYRANASSGFVVRVDRRGARVVADGLGYTNECLVSPDGKTLYVNETFGRRLTRFRIRADGSLGEKATIATFGAGTFPDGLAQDVEGGLWVVSIVSNRVLRIDPSGRIDTIVEDLDSGHVGIVEAAFQSDSMGRMHLDTAAGARLRNISSLAFGGSDLKTAYLGCLLGDAIYGFQSPVPGLPPLHWNVSLGALAEKVRS